MNALTVRHETGHTPIDYRIPDSDGVEYEIPVGTSFEECRIEYTNMAPTMPKPPYVLVEYGNGIDTENNLVIGSGDGPSFPEPGTYDGWAAISNVSTGFEELAERESE